MNSTNPNISVTIIGQRGIGPDVIVGSVTIKLADSEVPSGISAVSYTHLTLPTN